MRAVSMITINNITRFTDPADLPNQRALFETVVTPGFFAEISGGGIFGGPSHGGLEFGFEYLLLSNPIFNTGVYIPAGIPTVTQSFPGPDVIQQNILIPLTNANGHIFQANYTLETHFPPCSALIAKMVLLLPPEMITFISASIPSVLALCQKIQTSCVGPNQQFPSLIECGMYYVTLRKSACSHVFIGDSINCRFIHSSLIQFRPNIHCPHTGPQSAPCSADMCRAYNNGQVPAGAECTYNFRFNNGDCNQIGKFEHLLSSGVPEVQIKDLL
jgi:hypothetical protein